MNRLTAAVIVAAYLAAVVAANLIVNHYGPSSTPYVAFGLVGCALIMRDRFADVVGPSRVLAQVGLIAAGALITYLLNTSAAKIAAASVIAFSVSEAVEAVVYLAVFHRPWLERGPGSAAVGAAIDSVLFITIAFGWDFPTIWRQWVAKVAGAFLWALLIQIVRERREVLPRHASDRLA